MGVGGGRLALGQRGYTTQPAQPCWGWGQAAMPGQVRGLGTEVHRPTAAAGTGKAPLNSGHR